MRFLLVLLSAILVMAAVAASLPGAEPNDSKTRDAIRAVRQLGGRVNWQDAGWEIGFHLRGRKLTDTQLEVLNQLSPIRSLNLRDTQVTDAGMETVARTKTLQRLHLERTQVGDVGVKQLASLVDLEYLNLYGTQVTDASVVELAKLRKLQSLYLWKTKVTAIGRARLAMALPQAKVVGGLDLTRLADTFPSEAEMPKPAAALTWMAASSRADAPQRSLNGINVQLFFENQSKEAVKLYWITYGGELKFYGVIQAGGSRQQNTYENNAWLITDSNETPLGWFLAKQDNAKAVIPQ